MQIGVIGLGRMRGKITRRLIQNGHEAAVCDHDPNAVALLRRDGAIGAATLDKLVAQLRPPHGIWLMLPAGKITEGFRPRRGHTFAEKILSAMRKGFGALVEPKISKAKPS
jgi:6-phosphogluconate dehydrogenase (decarboxylating)